MLGTCQGAEGTRASLVAHAAAQLFTVHVDELNHIHVSNLWNKLGRQLRNSRQASELREAHNKTLCWMVERTTLILPDCDAQALAMMRRHYRVPPANASAEAARADPGAQQRLFDDFLFLTQVQQARCYETAFAKWRRDRSAAAQTMGIL